MACLVVRASFDTTVHLVPEASAGGLMKRAGAARERVHVAADRLNVGPCAVAPERHAALREAWYARAWGVRQRAFGLDELRVAIGDGRLPVVVWASRGFSDLLWLWWVLDGIERLDCPEPLLVARPWPADLSGRVGGATVDEAEAALAAARPVTHRERREGSELWRKFAVANPLPFDEARRNGSIVFPELSECGDVYGAWFPRLEGGRLRLSQLDELLLGSLREQWLTMPELMGELSGRERQLDAFGLMVAVLRLKDWAARGVVQHRRCDAEQDAFRLTDRARALLAQGLESVGDAPVIDVGGCKLGDPAAPWVRVADGSGWRLAS